MRHMMPVYIPSRSRPDRSLTLEAIGGEWNGRVAIVVPAKQARDYRALGARHGVRVLACPAQGIARTREWIGQHCKADRFLMMDDDLRFTRRKSVDDWQLHMFRPGDMTRMLTRVYDALDKYKHVSVCPRQFNVKYSTHVPPSGVEPEPEKYPGFEIGRPLRVLAYQKQWFLECEHGRVDIMEDFDVTLQLIRMGFPNYIITNFSQDQPVTQMAGGCSDYRTHEVHAKNVKKLAALHKGYISIKEKNNKTGGEFGKRLEAMIQWAKAYKLTLDELTG